MAVVNEAITDVTHVRQENDHMKRTHAFAIAAATMLIATTAVAAEQRPRDEIQAPRDQHIQAPRDQEVQAPRGDEIQAPRS
jgi:hypothetical protein